MSDQTEAFTVTYSIDGFRRGLNRNLAELKALILDSDDGDIYEDLKSDLLDTLNDLINQSNGFNCVSVKEVEGFSDMSELYLAPSNDEEDEE